MNRVKLSIVAAFVLCGTTAFADEVPPGDVKFEDFAVPVSLTDVPGNAEAGAEVFKDRGLGNCLACHVNSDMKDQLFQGTVGPPVDGAASRWEPAQLRAIVANAKKIFGDQTVMPGFYSLEVGKDVAKDLVGKTILTAQQVEDVVAYLSTLKE